MKILYVGSLCDCDGSATAYHRMLSFERLGHDVIAIDTHPYPVRQKQAAFLYRLSNRLFQRGFDGIGPIRFGPRDLANVNQQIVDRINRNLPDIIWLDKAITIEKATLSAIKKISPSVKIIGYSPDDMMNRWCQSKQFLEHAELYDHYFTTKYHGPEELKAIGCRSVHYVDPGFEPEIHRPMPVDATTRERLGGRVGFIGAPEGVEGRGSRMESRIDAVVALAKAGVPVRVWGGGWRRRCPSHEMLRLEDRWVFGDDYATAICSFDIVLGFLRHSNRDVVTTRSFEIPACGGFMMAERSSAHLELFREDEEAVFFDTTEGMIDKVRYYLAHPEERRRIAAAGRARCLASGYSNTERAAAMLRTIRQRQNATRAMA